MLKKFKFQHYISKSEKPCFNIRHILIYYSSFIIRWGKERPLNTRLLIQNVEEDPAFDLNSVPGLEDCSDWNVQVFRSITSDSARFQLENETSFTTKKGRSVDNSIMRAYTNAIRRAKRFVITFFPVKSQKTYEFILVSCIILVLSARGRL